MDLLPDFRDLLAEFARCRVEVVVVGGYAVGFHGRPRNTKDLDLLLGSEPENLRRAAAALTAFGAPRSVVDGVRTMHRGQVVWFGQEPARVDLLPAIDGVSAPEVFARAMPASVDGLDVRVIGLEDLIANKRAAGRPQDLADVSALEQIRDDRGSV